MNTPLVTVLLISYNHADTFEKSIQSVLSQKTTFPVQIIVCDDASTDGTLEIINKYSNLENVTCILRDKNVGGQKNIYEALKLINTKYFAILETDDYWCDDTKLQTQIDVLENNPDCSFCAHNTLVNYTFEGKTKKFLNGVKTGKFTFPPRKITKKYYIEPHTSSRVCRTEVMNLEEIKNTSVLSSDISSNFYFLTKGSLYYIDKFMSVYNYTGRGIYSGVSSYRQRYNSALRIKELNAAFGYKYNNLLARFFATRLNLIFFKYLNLKYTKKPELLAKMYNGILKDYERKYLNNREKKPVFLLDLPLNRKTSLVFELRREKERV